MTQELTGQRAFSQTFFPETAEPKTIIRPHIKAVYRHLREDLRLLPMCSPLQMFVSSEIPILVRN